VIQFSSGFLATARSFMLPAGSEEMNAGGLLLRSLPLRPEYSEGLVRNTRGVPRAVMLES